MNLKEILAKKTVTPLQENRDLPNRDYILQDRKIVDEDKFLAAWSIRLANPYYSPQPLRELVQFLTTDNTYVLNTFFPVNIQILMNLYIERNPPTLPIHHHFLWLLLADIELHVPSVFQDPFEDIIKKKFPLTKNFDCGKI